jgi:hypothetical protein
MNSKYLSNQYHTQSTISNLVSIGLEGASMNPRGELKILVKIISQGTKLKLLRDQGLCPRLTMPAHYEHWNQFQDKKKKSPPLASRAPQGGLGTETPIRPAHTQR